MAISTDTALTNSLRRTAEQQLAAKFPETHFSGREEDLLRLVHELEIHQIELEMQNAALHHARSGLESALEKYTDLYENAPVGFFTLDHRGVIQSVNLVGASLVAGFRSALIGRFFGQCVAVACRPVFTAFLAKVRDCQIKESCEVTLKNSNGRNQPVIVQIEGMATVSGHEIRLALLDVTEQRAAKDALIVKQAELEELNYSLDKRIGMAVDELRRKDQILIGQDRRAAMGEMINNIAHQWRQPLNVLGLHLQGLPVAYGKAEFNKEYLSVCVNKCMDLILHMSGTINDFRDFFRVDKEIVSFSVNQVIGRMLTLIEENFKDKKILIEVHSENDPVVSGYPNEYAQVLVNILMNAGDALCERNIDAAMIAINVFAEGDKTVVTISDNAGGIDEEIMDNIFDPYFTTKGPDKGTGVGLFMSKTIIEKNMGGKLTVHNSARGAEFRIEL